MDEYISRESVEKYIEAGLNNPDKAKAFGHDAIEILAEVHYMPAADVLPVVRCSECKHWKKDVAGCTEFAGRCDYANYMIGANGYCLYGERKENG